ncbi:MAG: hypothetical protein ACRD5M_05040 [Candidatus Acidiferrales bacterium]
MNAVEREKEIGQRERTYDLAKNRVAALERSLEENETRRDSQYVHVTHDRLHLQIAKLEKDLSEARTFLVEAESKMHEAWSWRSPAARDEEKQL